MENGYSLDLIFNEINNRLKKLFNDKKDINKDNNSDVKENKKYLVLPYINNI